MKNIKNIVIGALLVTAAFLGWLVSKSDLPVRLSATGGMLVENYIPVIMYNGGYASNLPMKVGANGTSISEKITGFCSLIGADVSQAASSTVPYDCAVTGAEAGDVVIAQLSTSTPNILNGWAVTGSKASTTSGFITIVLSNLTGTARIPSVTGVGSSTAYIVFDITN